MSKYILKIPKDIEEDLFTLALRSYEESGEILTENWASSGYTVTVRGVDFKVPSIQFKDIPKEFLGEIKDSEFDKYCDLIPFDNRVLEKIKPDFLNCWQASEKNTHLLYANLFNFVALIGQYKNKETDLFDSIDKEWKKILKIKKQQKEKDD
jgi:hypothetical protein